MSSAPPRLEIQTLSSPSIPLLAPTSASGPPPENLLALTCILSPASGALGPPPPPRRWCSLSCDWRGKWWSREDHWTARSHPKPAEKEGHAGLWGGVEGAQHRWQHPGVPAEPQILSNLHRPVECLHDVLHDRAVWFLSSRCRTKNTPSQSLSSSVPDNFKNVPDQKPSDLPRKSKLVVGGKKCSPRCTWYPSHITVFFSKMFLLWLLPWNPVYLKSLRRVYVKGWDNVAFPKDKRSYLIRAESLFYQAFPGNPFLCLFWFIFNNHPFLVRVIQIRKNLSYPGIWGRKVGFSVWCSLLLDCVCDDWASSLLLVQCPDSFPITVGCARPPCVTKVAPGLRGWSIMGSHGREVQSSWQGGWGFYEKLCLAWKSSSIEVTFGDH